MVTLPDAWLSDDLALRLMEATEVAALACLPWRGLRDPISADEAATQAMRSVLATCPIDGVVVIGEGERDEAPMLAIGERVGAGGVAVDIAVDPLEGTQLCAEDRPGALCVMAVGPRGSLLHAPDCYMEKWAALALAEGRVTMAMPVDEKLRMLAALLEKDVSSLRLVVLDRPRHASIIEAAEALGVRVQRISDGDVTACLQAAWPLGDGQVDVYLGIGGAPEGVLAAAGLKALGGSMEGRLLWKDAAQWERARAMGLGDPDTVYAMGEMVQSPALFCATSVTPGSLLAGPERLNEEHWRVHTALLFPGSCRIFASDYHCVLDRPESAVRMDRREAMAW